MRPNRWTTALLLLLSLWTPRALSQPAAPPAAPRVLTIDFATPGEEIRPRVGFLGGLRDSLPDELIAPLSPALWRIGHQFRGRIAAGLPAAVDRVEKLGARYKLVMSDLVKSNFKDWAQMDWPRYEADLTKLVQSVGDRAARIIWEPVNEPDISHKPIEHYYELYGRAFKILRALDPRLELCGPGFAYPSYDKYRKFLEYCREQKLECNYLAWHYTGWDPATPEQQKRRLGELPTLAKEFPAQRVREVHCDEWGAGPDKPGRLHPGRAVVWFYYLEQVYKVDRACRANWGKEDDYLAGIVTAEGQPHPVYQAYRAYGATKGQTRVPCTGGDRYLAALASKQGARAEVLLGYIGTTDCAVTLQLRGLPATAEIEVHRWPDTGLDGTLPKGELPKADDAKVERRGDEVRLTLPAVRENQAYQVVVNGK